MPVLKTIVEPATKTRFRSMAQVRGQSESELLRAVVLTVTGEDADTERVVKPDPQKTELDRMTVRMPRFLLVATQQRALFKSIPMCLHRYSNTAIAAEVMMNRRMPLIFRILLP